MKAVAIDASRNRHFDRWLVRVRLGCRWFAIVNLADPRFWQHIWVMWEGRRLWAFWFWVRHICRRLPV